MSRTSVYIASNAHAARLIPVAPALRRRCNICHEIIDKIPANADPRHVRFCARCRNSKSCTETDADKWIGGGHPGGSPIRAHQHRRILTDYGYVLEKIKR